jgi:hypothetical protein
LIFRPSSRVAISITVKYYSTYMVILIRLHTKTLHFFFLLFLSILFSDSSSTIKVVEEKCEDHVSMDPESLKLIG